jgi:hypothetical protein
MLLSASPWFRCGNLDQFDVAVRGQVPATRPPLVAAHDWESCSDEIPVSRFGHAEAQPDPGLPHVLSPVIER